MNILTDSFVVNSKGNTDIIDITNNVQEKINSSGFIEGNVLVFVGGSTAGITTIEYEPRFEKRLP